MFEVNEYKGGITNAMLARTKLFFKNNIEANIATFNYNISYESIEEKLVNYEKIDPKAKILNIYNYYRQLNTLNSTIVHEQKNEMYSDDKYSLIVKQDNKTNYFQDGLLISSKMNDANGQTIYKEIYYKSGGIKERQEYKNGVLHRTIIYGLNHNIKSERLFTKDGFCYITKYYNDEKSAPQHIYLFNRKNDSVIHFNSLDEFSSYWLNKMCSYDKESGIQPIVIADGQGSLSRLLGVSNKLAKRYYVLHQNHFKAPYTYGSEIINIYNDVFKQYNELDGLILLTEKQKQDIINQFGNSRNIYVIPNFVNKVNTSFFVRKRSYTISMISRLAKRKAIDKAIGMFKNVVDVEPRAKLEIYGDGPERKKLENVIRKYELDNNVVLMGHTHNPHIEMQKSIATILTSETEGFGLVIAESLLNETPVVSLDCNYGPSDIIENGVDGFVVTNLKDMADKIVYLLENPNIAKKMGKKGRANMLEKFSPEVIFSKWEKLFNMQN